VTQPTEEEGFEAGLPEPPKMAQLPLFHTLQLELKLRERERESPNAELYFIDLLDSNLSFCVDEDFEDERYAGVWESGSLSHKLYACQPEVPSHPLTRSDNSHCYPLHYGLQASCVTRVVRSHTRGLALQMLWHPVFSGP
jgi:hypothetical protein